MEASHLLFVDDSGTKEYNESRSYGKSGATPYFVYAGLLLRQRAAGTVFSAFRDLKQQYFSTTDVEVKSHWLRRQEQRERRYLSRYDITDAQLTQFSESCYDLLLRTECELVACAVNKAEVQAQYPRPHQPSAIAYECLLQRLQFAMTNVGHADVVIDEMEGATRAGNQYRDNLRRQHNSLRQHGGRMAKGVAFSNVGSLSFTDSKADERIQLADLVAYSVYRQFVDHGDLRIEKARTPMYGYLERLLPKFRVSPAGEVAGYGVVRFPTRPR